MHATRSVGSDSRAPGTGERRLNTVVIGGSQAGLAVGYHLGERGLPFVILDAHERVGDAWRKRWDSLRLFTPARYDALPGMRFPARGSHHPTKDEVADYLEQYAREFELPVRTAVRVERVAKVGAGFEVSWGHETLSAENVVLATGAYHRPRVPEFAPHLDDGIVQLHSKEYRSPSQIQKGGVLVVGAGNSGAEIAVELAADHDVFLSGPDVGQEPARIGTLAGRLVTPLIWLAAHRILRADTPWGRKARDHFTNPPRGVPLARVRRKDFPAAGIERVPRTTGVQAGRPVLQDGRVLDVSNVVWCTGLTPGYEGIDLPLESGDGPPAHHRGVVENCPGLYLMGLLFLHTLSSALVGGVGRDAEHIVDHIAARAEVGAARAGST